MDKKEGETIDLESLRGFTAGPWEVGAKGYGAPGYVYCDNSLGSAVAIVYGAPMRHSVFSRAEEEANARLIAAAPSMHAELTARRARDADVEALVAAATPFVALLQAHNEFDHKRNPVSGHQPVFGINDVTIRIGDLRLLRAALLPFLSGDKT